MNEAERIAQVLRFMEDRSDETLTLDALASMAGMSKYHFARRFKSFVGVSPKRYAANLRVQQLKKNLKASKGVASAVYDAGYGSASRVYEKASESLGMTPAQYRRSGEGVAISFATLDTQAGLMMIGATDRGICFVQFGDSEEALASRLQAEYQNAKLAPMSEPHHPQFARWVAAINRHLNGDRERPNLPLDINGTAFQMRVWKYLQTIPYGEVASYREVAAGIGEAQSARAVANACGRNPVAVVVPCHRVIRESGALGGYRWGLERKRALLDRERAVKAGAKSRNKGLRELAR